LALIFDPPPPAGKPGILKILVKIFGSAYCMCHIANYLGQLKQTLKLFLHAQVHSRDMRETARLSMSNTCLPHQLDNT